MVFEAIVRPKRVVAQCTQYIRHDDQRKLLCMRDNEIISITRGGACGMIYLVLVPKFIVHAEGKIRGVRGFTTGIPLPQVYIDLPPPCLQINEFGGLMAVIS